MKCSDLYKIVVQFLQVEYQVEQCDLSERSNKECIDTKKAKMIIPRGGDIVYGSAHQHSAGIGSTLYGQVIIGYRLSFIIHVQRIYI